MPVQPVYGGHSLIQNLTELIFYVQCPQKHQKYVARILGLPMSKVVCKTKRIGGGFGGKETRSAWFAAVASVPSYLLNRPVKLTLDRDVDMLISGQRHSFLGKYKVTFSLLEFSHGNILSRLMLLFTGFVLNVLG